MLDDRLLRATIFLSGVPHTYDRLAITAIGTKFATGISNVCELRVANIDKDVRDKLLTEGTPRARQIPPKNAILIEAGRESTGYTTIFLGDITDVNISQAPDFWLSMNCITGQYRQKITKTIALPAITPFSTICRQVASSLELSLDFQAPDKNVTNFSWSGSLEKMVHALNEISRGVVAYVDDGKLVVRNSDETDAATIDVSIETGLVGIPEWVDLGVRCRVLVNRPIELGSLINLTSKAYPAVNGEYIVYKLGFNLANRDVPFYYLFEASSTTVGQK